jgi:hypothetical protein
MHDLTNSLSVRGSGSEHGDERGEKSRFVRGAEERWGRYRVDRLWGERAQGERTHRTGAERRTVCLVGPLALRCQKGMRRCWCYAACARGEPVLALDPWVGQPQWARAHVLNTVPFLNMRKIPPPTRPTDFASRTWQLREVLMSSCQFSIGRGQRRWQ